MNLFKINKSIDRFRSMPGLFVYLHDFFRTKKEISLSYIYVTINVDFPEPNEMTGPLLFSSLLLYNLAV